jgi:hypothetical protein
MTHFRIHSWLSLAALAAAFVAVPVLAGGTDTFTGTVTDNMCSNQHQEISLPDTKTDGADCVRQCVKQRKVQYALLSGGKLYTLKTTDPALLNKLGVLAWKNARVTGVADGGSIAVQSVSAVR